MLLHGVIGLTRSIALDRAARGIRINAICLGTIDMPMARVWWRRTSEVDGGFAAL